MASAEALECQVSAVKQPDASSLSRIVSSSIKKQKFNELQSINQSIDRSIRELINQSINRSINGRTRLSYNQPINLSIDRSNAQLTNQPIPHSTEPIWRQITRLRIPDHVFDPLKGLMKIVQQLLIVLVFKAALRHGRHAVPCEVARANVQVPVLRRVFRHKLHQVQALFQPRDAPTRTGQCDAKYENHQKFREGTGDDA